MAKDLQKDLQELLTGGFLKVVKDNRGENYCLTDNQQGNTAAYPLYDNEFTVKHNLPGSQKSADCPYQA